ncbi:adenosine 5'-monophosphoramidase HINT3-like [Solea solea]|uniref:adenosine 5'-monophosphoramidase HINT3-like n=1 Tax=Solea solea TaxID=90069 RepID=UPI00272DAA80|nr:adenosine 5'-monophosphoramidase HINT3-like [Solea solea]
MARGFSTSLVGESVVESCIFCSIANEQDEETEILAKNRDMVCFRDIDPAAPHHYLVIPRKHIHSCSSLHRKHIDLVERMAEMGKAVLHDQGFADMNDISMGFHLPPFISVNHLHLHVLAPSSQISRSMIFKFTPRTESFILEQRVREQLKNISPLHHFTAQIRSKKSKHLFE